MMARAALSAEEAQACGQLQPAPAANSPARTITIVALPEDIRPEHDVEGSFVVLIDVQRMTTTLATAMANGAAVIRVFREVEEVLATKAEMVAAGQGGEILLGGERHGQQIEGFDGDNSPRAYLRPLEGKTLLFTTTNGSKAAQFVKAANSLVFGSFVNMRAVREAAVLSRAHKILLVCSGTGGERSDEDEIFAGALAVQLRQCLPTSTLSAGVTEEIIARVEGPVAVSGAASGWAVLEKQIRESTNGEMLISLGLGDDFDVILDVDRYPDTLPTYNPASDSFTEGSRSSV